MSSYKSGAKASLQALLLGLCLLGQIPANAQSAQSGEAALSATERALNQALAAYSEDRFADAAAGFAATIKLGRPGPKGAKDASVGLARYNLAMMHLRGELRGANPQTARALLTQSAADGVIRAHHALAQVYEQGLGGRKNLVLSNRWLESGAALGHVDAQTDFATNLMLGRGIAKNMERAAHWFREAAKGGDVGAQYLIAGLYEQGDGVPQDLRLAAYWYGVAAANGDEAAPIKFKELQSKLQN
jgi:uncharacterized protein